jgi:hypothetical protein
MSSTSTARALIRESLDRDQQTPTGRISKSDAAEPSMQESIKQVAYALWEKRGRPEGTAEEDWREAEQQVRLLQEQTTVFRG